MVRTKHNTTCWLITIVILILHTVLGTTSFLQKSATYDEPGHIAGGYISLKYSDFRSNPEGGQLAQRLAAIPLLMLNIDNPIEPPVEQLGKKKYSEKTYYEGLNILYENNTHRPYALLLSRLVILLSSAFGGMLLFLLSRKIWGPFGAVITVAVYGFSPTILAHARLVTPDLFVAVFFTFAVFAVWHVLHKISISGILLAGTTVGCLVLSKFSGLLIGPHGSNANWRKSRNRSPTDHWPTIQMVCHTFALEATAFPYVVRHDIALDSLGYHLGGI